MVWVRSPVYFYKRNDTFYFSRAVPSDLRHRFNKKKIEVSLRTKSEAKAAKSAAALSDRLERYWDSIRFVNIQNTPNMRYYYTVYLLGSEESDYLV